MTDKVDAFIQVNALLEAKKEQEKAVERYKAYLHKIESFEEVLSTLAEELGMGFSKLVINTGKANEEIANGETLKSPIEIRVHLNKDYYLSALMHDSDITHRTFSVGKSTLTGELLSGDFYLPNLGDKVFIRTAVNAIKEALLEFSKEEK